MDPLLISICCFVLAVGLAVLDLLLPSGGVLAILSAAAAVASVLFGFRSSNPAGMTMLTLLLISVPVFLGVALRLWPHTPIGKLIVLRAPEEETASSTRLSSPLHQLIGQVGVAQNALMPTGHVRIDHHNYNAVTERGLIEAGQLVEVLAVSERNLVVAITSKLPAHHAAQRTQEPPKPSESLLDRPAAELGLDSLEN